MNNNYPDVGERINFNTQALQDRIKFLNMDFITFVQRFAKMHFINTGREVNLQSNTEYTWLKNIYSGKQNSMYERTILTVSSVLFITIGSKEYDDIFEPKAEPKQFAVTVLKQSKFTEYVTAKDRKEAGQQILDLFNKADPYSRHVTGCIKEIKD